MSFKLEAIKLVDMSQCKKLDPNNLLPPPPPLSNNEISSNLYQQDIPIFLGPIFDLINVRLSDAAHRHINEKRAHFL